MSNQQTILLTGATGFLGSHLLEALLVKGYRVVILKRSTSNTWRIDEFLDQVISYDIDQQPLELAFEQQSIDVVVHTACHYGRNSDPAHKIVDTNLMFGLRVLDACLKFNTSAFFNTDTLLYKDFNAYTLSKKQLLEWLKQQSDKIQVVNLRLEHMYGPKDDANKFVAWVISQLNSNVPEINLTKGEQLRDFIYIDDVVSAYMIALEKLSCLASYNDFEVGTGQSISIKSFLQSLEKIYEEYFGAKDTKLAFGAIPYREGEMMSINVDNESLMELGWSPKIKLVDGLKNIIKEQV